MSYLRPPRVDLAWTATSLTTAFGGYQIYRRPSRAPAAAWVQVGAITIPTGYTAATVETQHNRWTDYEAGWHNANGTYPDGWDYAVTVINATTGVESAKSTLDTRNQIVADTVPWIVSNLQPALCHPVPRVSAVTGNDDDTLQSYRIAGRDLLVTRQRAEMPARIYELAFDDFAGPRIAEGLHVGEDLLRLQRAASLAGIPVCLHRPLGDRCIGALSPPRGIKDAAAMLYLAATCRLVETSRDLSALADYNLPAGLALTGGSSHYITTPDVADLDPGSSAFSLVAMFSGITGAGSDGLLTKGDMVAAAADGYGLVTTAGANVLRFRVDGATSAVNVDRTDASLFDANPHVVVATSSGTAQAVYTDGTLTPVATGSTTHGSVANATALTLGSSAAAAGTYTTGTVHAALLYARQLTPAEAQAAAYYLLGYPGWRLPGGAVLCWDLRDERCWPGTGTSLTDLAGNGHAGTLINSPPTKGIPWNLARLDIW